MRTPVIALLISTLVAGPALAGGMKASLVAGAGQAPQVWTHEPGPGDHLHRFQILLVDDHTCPEGQIKKFTSGGRGVHATRECVSR